METKTHVRVLTKIDINNIININYKSIMLKPMKHTTKTSKIKNIMKKVDSMGLDDIERNCNYNKMIQSVYDICYDRRGINTLQMNILFTRIDLTKLFKNNYYTSAGLNFEEHTLEVEYYREDKRLVSQFMFYKLCELFKECKPIIMFADLLNYLCMEDSEFRLDMSSHTVCYIFLPIEDDAYEMIYINPHGEYVNEDHKHYNLYITRCRSRLFELDCGVDYYLNRAIVKAFNKYVRYYEYNKIICYNESKYYNYSGVNMQQGDNYGFCYIFPFLLFYNMVYRYNEINLEYDLPSFDTLLKLKELQTIMMIVLAPYSKKLSEILVIAFKGKTITKGYDKLLVEYKDDLNNLFERNTTIILKSAIKSYLNFITQPIIKDKFTEYVDAETPQEE